MIRSPSAGPARRIATEAAASARDRPPGARLALLVAVVVTLASLACIGPAPARPATGARTVPVLTVSGPIGPAFADYVVRALDAAAAADAPAAVLRLDTPGGLDTSMRRIVGAILDSPVAVIGYVSPGGARAASAGTFILLATHVAAMAPATTLGAATPVRLGAPFGGTDDGRGERDAKPSAADADDARTAGTDVDGDGADGAGGPSDDRDGPRPTLDDKALNDAVAYIRGLAHLRGRNASWAARAVTAAESLYADEALADDVIDLVADDVPGLLAATDGREVTLRGARHRIDTAGAEPRYVDPDWRTELLAVITDPTVAYVLLMIGIYGLIFEFWTPGTIGPGIVGGICLLLALYALQFLPVDYTGFALIALGAALILAEAFAPSFGVLGIGGVIASVLGSMMLLETDAPGFAVSLPLIAVLAASGAGGFLLVLALMARARRRPVVSGPEEMLGAEGQVIDWNDGAGHVRTHGEVWQARAATVLTSGERVRVSDRDGLVLVVEPLPPTRSGDPL